MKLHNKSWAVIDRPYSTGSATVGALYERLRLAFFGNPWHRGLCAALAGALLWNASALGQGNATAVAPPSSEYAVKAAFLLNFVRFVEWPPPVRAQTNQPFFICILGDDPFRRTLDTLVEDETVNGRRVVVRRINRWQGPCQLLFVSQSERDVFRTLGQVGPGVLTVGEEPGFLTDGGIINFVIDGRRVRFDVNQKAAATTGLRINSRLLGVARTVLR